MALGFDIDITTSWLCLFVWWMYYQPLCHDEHDIKSILGQVHDHVCEHSSLFKQWGQPRETFVHFYLSCEGEPAICQVLKVQFLVEGGEF